MFRKTRVRRVFRIYSMGVLTSRGGVWYDGEDGTYVISTTATYATYGYFLDNPQKSPLKPDVTYCNGLLCITSSDT